MRQRCIKYYIDPDFTEHTTSSSSSSSSSSKRPRLDQIPAANLDADDPLTDVRPYIAVLIRHCLAFLQLSHKWCLIIGWWWWRFWGGQRWWRHCSSSGRIGEDQERTGWRARTQSKILFQTDVYLLLTAIVSKESARKTWGASKRGKKKCFFPHYRSVSKRLKRKGFAWRISWVAIR